MRGLGGAVAGILLALVLAGPTAAEDVRVKDLGRFLGWRENALVGYGIVTGLAGSGDSPRSEITRQALKNVLSRLGANVSLDQIQSRNVAAVIVTATLPPAANIGDRIDATVSSIGDARSLVGGTLLMTPLSGPDQHPYALAQGTLVVGGYRFDANMNRQQQNYPAAGVLPAGATVEQAVTADLVAPDGTLTFVLKDADVTTAERIAAGINSYIAPGVAGVRDAGSVTINARAEGGDIYRLISRIESLTVTPDELARVVINERSGTVVSGGGVRISSVVVSQGDIRVSVTIENDGYDGYGYGGGRGRGGLVVSNTRLDVAEPRDAVIDFPNTTVADLVDGLTRLHVNTRGVISVLQAIKAAGALHAELIVQ
ncbi:MAG TPA: flagellar basal body P-ring protein FlgI [Caulobacteraceae bacterium]|jgi:flagellar P-ring protein precursor FlgI